MNTSWSFALRPMVWPDFHPHRRQRPRPAERNPERIAEVHDGLAAPAWFQSDLDFSPSVSVGTPRARVTDFGDDAPATIEQTHASDSPTSRLPPKARSDVVLVPGEPATACQFTGGVLWRVGRRKAEEDQGGGHLSTVPSLIVELFVMRLAAFRIVTIR
jgi:hypothetical protein